MAIGAAVTGACAGSQVDVKKSNTRYDLSVDFLRHGNLDRAEVEAKKALDFNPDNAQAYNVLGLVSLLRAKQNQDLVEVQDCLTGIDAEGIRQELEQHLHEADKRFARAGEIDPEFGEAFANRGVVALNLDDYEAARKYFEHGLQFPTRLTSASLTRANLGWAYFLAGNMVAAAKELRQASQFQPGMCLSSYRLGRVYFERKEWDKALEKFREVALQEAQCPIQEDQLFLAMTYQKTGTTSEIPRAVEACVKLAPNSCLAARCRALAAESQPPQAGQSAPQAQAARASASPSTGR